MLLVGQAYRLKRRNNPELIDVTKGQQNCDFLIIGNAAVNPKFVKSKFNVAAPSMNENLKEFRRRKNQTFYMVNFTLEEAQQAFLEQLADAEDREILQFKFDVFGGNPRILAEPVDLREPTMSGYLEDLILKQCEFFFGEVKEYHWWACAKICNTAQHLDLNKLIATNLFMKIEIDLEKEERTGQFGYKKLFCSTFMGSLEEIIKRKEKHDLTAVLLSIFQKSGIGFCTEYLATNLILGSENSTIVVLNHDREIVDLKIPALSKHLIRNLNDLATLNFCDYGLPTISNFPVIDGIFMSRECIYLIQVTISNTHKTAKALQTLVDILKKAFPNVPIIILWVLSNENLFSFKPGKIWQDHGITSYRMLAEKNSKSIYTTMIKKERQKASSGGTKEESKEETTVVYLHPLSYHRYHLLCVESQTFIAKRKRKSKRKCRRSQFIYWSAASR
jgi:hypothetical protein